MLYRLRRHPFPVVARFRHVLALTFALPAERLAPLLPPGLTLDAHGPWGLLAAAMVWTERMRPAFLPRALGRDFFLSGYRIFARFEEPSGRRLRGLFILESGTDHRLMVGAGNLFTHYHYRLCRPELERGPGRLAVRLAGAAGETELEVEAELAEGALLPPGSVFSTAREALRFAGPLPYTFSHEPETGSMILIRGVRERWRPRLVAARVGRCALLERPVFAGAEARFCSAFYLEDVPYRWLPGRREPISRRRADPAAGAAVLAGRKPRGAEDGGEAAA